MNAITLMGSHVKAFTLMGSHMNAITFMGSHVNAISLMESQVNAIVHLLTQKLFNYRNVISSFARWWFSVGTAMSSISLKEPYLSINLYYGAKVEKFILYGF